MEAAGEKMADAVALEAKSGAVAVEMPPAPPAASAGSKQPVAARARSLYVSPRFRNALRAAFAYEVAAIFAFISAIATQFGFPYRGNIVVGVVVMAPMLPLGPFFSQLVFGLAGVGAGCLAWTAVLGISQGSLAAMAVLLFLIYWPANALRATSMAFMGFALLVSLMTFFAIFTAVYQTNGAFVPREMMDFAGSFTLGLAVSALSAVLIFPASAAAAYRRAWNSALVNLAGLAEIAIPASRDFSKDPQPVLQAVGAVRRDISGLQSDLGGALSEPVVVGEFAPGSLGPILSATRTLQVHLLSFASFVSAATSSADKDRMVTVGLPISNSLLDRVVAAVSAALRNVASPPPGRDLAAVAREGADSLRALLQEYEGECVKTIAPEFSALAVGITFANRETLKRCAALLDAVADLAGPRKLRLNPAAFDIRRLFHVAPAANGAQPAAATATGVRAGFGRVFHSLGSDASVYGLKVATAVTLVALIMLIPGPGRQFFIQWNMAASALTLVILLSNTTGGTFLGSVLQLGGVVLAWAWSLASLCAFPDNRPGLAFMFAPIALFGFGMIQLSPAFTVLGLTTLITYPQVVLGYYWNHITLPPQVFSDSPLVFATRTLVASAIGCGFALAFTVLIFPRSAKAALRRDVAHVFEVIGEIGTLLNTAAAGKDAGGAPALDAKEGEAYTVLLAQEQQLAFAKAEIAIGLPVDEAAYRTVMQKLYGVLDRLVAVGVSYPEGEHLAHVKGLADVTAGMVMDSWMCAESVRGGRRMPEAREQWVEADEGGDDRDCATVEEVTLIAFVKAVNYVAGELSSLRGTINDVVGRL